MRVIDVFDRPTLCWTS